MQKIINKTSHSANLYVFLPTNVMNYLMDRTSRLIRDLYVLRIYTFSFLQM